jgi:arsenite-transporting ATPase
VANRVFPSDGADAWRLTWAEAQSAVLAEVEQSFTGLPIWRSSYQASEPVGVDALAAFAAAAYGGDDPLATPTAQSPMTVSRTRSGATLRIALPFVARSDIDLARHGDELVVTVGSYRRLVALPAALARQTVAGARIEDGALRVRFRVEEPA